jgi:hypothetical protein
MSTTTRRSRASTLCQIGSALFMSAGILVVSDRVLLGDEPLNSRRACIVPTMTCYGVGQGGNPGNSYHTGTPCLWGTLCTSGLYCDSFPACFCVLDPGNNRQVTCQP